MSGEMLPTLVPDVGVSNTEGSSSHLSWRSVLVRARLPLLVGMHLLAFAISYLLAFLLRFEIDPPEAAVRLFCNTVPWVISIKLVVFYFSGNFNGWLRYVTFADLKALFRASLFAEGAVLALDVLVFHNDHIPRLVLVGDIAFSAIFLGALRCSWRLYSEEVTQVRRRRLLKHHSRRALIVGANQSGAVLAVQLRGSQRWPYTVIGFVDGDRFHHGSRLGGLPVLGAIAEIRALIERHRISDVLVISESLTGADMRQLVQECRGLVELKVIPAVDSLLDLSSGKLLLRDVDINDLLRRDPIQLDGDVINKMLKGKTVMVTGAGGSIGSEICRQVLKFAPRSLVLVEQAENSLFHIEREVLPKYPEIDIRPCIADVLNEERMRAVFEKHTPHVIFHAAAHKHVPMMEWNPGEAISNNVFGTRQVADLANEFGAESFVLISTDKAVNPTSVMGATKQLAERYVHSLSNESSTRFVVVRFGNVLGSAGSVVPIFQEQIRRGGPITITDARMTRFFMTIPEASQLVLQAGAMGKGGEIFVLDMGTPVKIVDLAKDIIRLSGLDHDTIEIQYTGMRPGEKLYEELYFDDEETLPTSHPKLRSAYHRPYLMADVRSTLMELRALCVGDPREIRCRLWEFVHCSGENPGRTQSPLIGTRSESPETAVATSDGHIALPGGEIEQV
jgi:FlaA1/EpsC-like NDP-sugar epimerase